MPSLHDIQHAMRRSIVERDDAEAALHIVSGPIAASDRLSVYRNAFLAVLQKALRLSFPAVDRLVGAEFFDGAAARLIHEEPPHSGYLDEYGAGFPHFLARFRPAASLPYLADVARLEWAVSQALHAPDAESLDVSSLAGCSSEIHARIQFTPHPSLRLLRTEYPADAIWRAVLEEDDEALASLDLASGQVLLLVQRGEAGLEVRRLPEPIWRLISALCEGQALGQALEAILESEVSEALADFLANGRFSGFSVPPASTTEISPGPTS